MRNPHKGFITLGIAIALAGLVAAGIGGSLYLKSQSPAIGAPAKTTTRDLEPFTDSTYEVGSSTGNAYLRMTTDELCLTGDSCQTTWPAGGGGGDSTLFTWNQSTNVISTDGASTTATTSLTTFTASSSQASTTALTVHGNTYFAGLADGCLETASGLVTSTGADCGSGSGGGLASGTPWTAGDLTEVVDDGTIRSTSTVSASKLSTDVTLDAEINTESLLQTFLSDVTDIFTNNDGALNDDDLSDNSTTDLSEGTNLYYTDARVSSYIAGSSSVPNVNGSNPNVFLQWVSGAWSAVASSTFGIAVSDLIGSTDDLTEGSTNLYHTTPRVEAILSATTTLPNLSITESQVSDLTHYTDNDVSSYISGSSSVPNADGTVANKLLIWSGSAWAANASNTLNIAVSDLVGNTDNLTQGSTNLYNQTHTGDVTGATALSIANDAVTPDDVLSTGQTDEFCLTYETTGDTWEWQTCGSGGGGGAGFATTTDGGVEVTYTNPNNPVYYGGTASNTAEITIDYRDGSITLASSTNATATIIASTGELRIGSTTQETLTFDFDDTANYVVLKSFSGVTDFSLGNLNINVNGDSISDLTGAGLEVNSNILRATITPSVINSRDAAGDEECLTYETTGAVFEWQTCGGAGTVYIASTTPWTAGDITEVVDDGTIRSTSTLSASKLSSDVTLDAEINTEALLQTFLTDVTDVFTNNDGALSDDDLSNNSTTDLSEGSNLYHTTARVEAILAGTTTLPNLTTLLGLTNASTTALTVTGNTYLTGLSQVPLYVDSTGLIQSAGSGTSGNCVQWGANNTLADSGAGCGGGSSEWTDTGDTVHPTETTDTVLIGDSSTLVNALLELHSTSSDTHTMVYGTTTRTANTDLLHFVDGSGNNLVRIVQNPNGFGTIGVGNGITSIADITAEIAIEVSGEPNIRLETTDTSAQQASFEFGGWRNAAGDVGVFEFLNMNGGGLTIAGISGNSDAGGNEGNLIFNTRNYSATYAERLRITTEGLVQITNDGTETGAAYSFFNDTDSGLWQDTADELSIGAGSVEFLTMTEAASDELVFNQDGDDIDFRGEYSGGNNSFTVLGNNGYFGVATVTPPTLLTVGSSTLDSIAAGELYRSAFISGELEVDGLSHLDGGASSTALTLTGLLHADGGIDLGASTNLSINGTNILSDSAGTLTLDFVDVLGATAEATIEAALDTLNNITNLVVSTLLDIPSSATLTLSNEGEFGLDTTDDQLRLHDGEAERVYAREHHRIFSVTVASTSPAFVSGGVLPIPPERDGYELTEFHCYVKNGTSIIMNVSDGTNDTETITCNTTISTDTDVATNDTFTAGELAELQFGTITGTPDYLTFTAYGHITNE